jgi:hypothetical protein
MQLNAEASVEERQLLLPFVTRLACADTAEVEGRRQAYINSLMPYRISFRQHLDVLDGALVIGRQADLFPSEEVKTRLEAVQQGANTATSVADYAVFSQMQTWFDPVLRIKLWHGQEANRGLGEIPSLFTKPADGWPSALVYKPRCWIHWG